MKHTFLSLALLFAAANAGTEKTEAPTVDIRRPTDPPDTPFPTEVPDTPAPVTPFPTEPPNPTPVTPFPTEPPIPTPTTPAPVSVAARQSHAPWTSVVSAPSHLLAVDKHRPLARPQRRQSPSYARRPAPRHAGHAAAPANLTRAGARAARAAPITTTSTSRTVPASTSSRPPPGASLASLVGAVSLGSVAADTGIRPALIRVVNLARAAATVASPGRAAGAAANLAKAALTTTTAPLLPAITATATVTQAAAPAGAANLAKAAATVENLARARAAANLVRVVPTTTTRTALPLLPAITATATVTQATNPGKVAAVANQARARVRAAANLARAVPTTTTRTAPILTPRAPTPLTGDTIMAGATTTRHPRHPRAAAAVRVERVALGECKRHKATCVVFRATDNCHM